MACHSWSLTSRKVYATTTESFETNPIRFLSVLLSQDQRSSQWSCILTNNLFSIGSFFSLSLSASFDWLVSRLDFRHNITVQPEGGGVPDAQITPGSPSIGRLRAIARELNEPFCNPTNLQYLQKNVVWDALGFVCPLYGCLFGFNLPRVVSFRQVKICPCCLLFFCSGLYFLVRGLNLSQVVVLILIAQVPKPFIATFTSTFTAKGPLILVLEERNLLFVHSQRLFAVAYTCPINVRSYLWYENQRRKSLYYSNWSVHFSVIFLFLFYYNS